jgi:predicted nucleic acid-binding protein
VDQIDPVRILNLHLQSDCSNYDCQFVDLARVNNVVLVTTDKAIIRSFPDSTADISQFASGR